MNEVKRIDEGLCAVASSTVMIMRTAQPAMDEYPCGGANTRGAYLPGDSEPDTSLGSKSTINLNELTQIHFSVN